MANGNGVDAQAVATLKQRRRPEADAAPQAAGDVQSGGGAQASPGKASVANGADAPRKALWSSGVAFYPPSKKYWRIGRKWYDLAPFLDKHPGGSEVLLLARDRFEDCTFAFEAHHANYQKARAIIRKYEVSADLVAAEGLMQRPKENGAYSDASMESSPLLLGDEAFYSVLRRRVHEYLRSVGCPSGGPTMACCVLFWFTFAAWATSLLLMWWSGTVVSAVFFGLCATYLGAFGHNWVHQPRYRFWAYLSLDTVGFSSTGWYREHNLQHHMYTNTPWDNHFKGVEPFLVTDPTVERNFVQKHILPKLTPLILCFGLHANWIAHAVELLKGNEEFSLGKLVLPMQVFAMAQRWGYWGLLLLFVSHCVLGNYYFTLALMNHNAESCVDVGQRNESADWAVAQLHSSADWDVTCPFFKAGRWLWLNYHTVHHLFPITDFSHHPAIQGLLIKTCEEFNVSYTAGEARKIHSEMLSTFSEPFSAMKSILVYAGGI